MRAIIGKYRVIIGCTRSDLLFKKGVTDEATIGISNGLNRPHYETIYIKANQFFIEYFYQCLNIKKEITQFLFISNSCNIACPIFIILHYN